MAMCSYYVMSGAACMLLTLMMLSKVGEWVQVPSSNACSDFVSNLSPSHIWQRWCSLPYYAYKEG